MSGGTTLTNILPALHEHFTGKNIVDIFYASNKTINPLLAAMEAKADTGEGGGRKLITPIIYGTGTSVGATFATVLAKAQSATVGASALYERWETDAMELNGVARWSRQAMDAALSKSQAETFKVVTREMDTKILALRNLWSTYCVGDGTGALAPILTVASTYITVDPSYINRFMPGQDLVCSSTSTVTSALLNSGTSIIVTGTDPNTGKVYLGSDPTTSTTWAAGDWVFNAADRPTAALTTNYILPHGMKQWLPGATVVDSSEFDGVTRDGKSELAGITYDCSSLEPESAFINALSLLFTQGGTKASALFCSAKDYAAFAAAKDKSKIVQIALGKYEMGFEGITVHSLAGNVPVIPDAKIPAGEFYAGPWDEEDLAPKLVYVGNLVNIDNKDGLEFRASSSSTDYEMRLYSRGNIIVPGPGKYVRGYGLSVS